MPRVKIKRRTYKQRGRSNVRIDRKRRAKAVGLRRSASGRLYIEVRKNRSDRKGSRI